MSTRWCSLVAATLGENADDKVVNWSIENFICLLIFITRQSMQQKYIKKKLKKPINKINDKKGQIQTGSAS